MDWNSVLPGVYAWLITTGLRIILILAVTFGAIAAARVLVFRLLRVSIGNTLSLENRKRADTLASVIRNMLYVVIWLISILTMLGALGIQIGPILAAAGVLGLAVGFGAQSLVQDIISGFFIWMEDQIRVGDVIQIGNISGQVEKVNLRVVVLRDVHGNVHYIRNNRIEVVTNMTKEYSYCVLDIKVASDENVEDVIGVIQLVGSELKASPDFGPDIQDDLEVLGLDQFDGTGMTIRARIRVRASTQWRLRREFNQRLKARLDALGIDVPGSQTSIVSRKGSTLRSTSAGLEMATGD